MPPATLVWFRDDLRLADHPAVAAAAAEGEAAAAFVFDAAAERLGGAAKWWLHHGLTALADALTARGGGLALRRGDAAAELAHLAAAIGAATVHALAARTPAGLAEQARVGAALARAGVALRLHRGALLHDPAAVRTRDGRPYAVFTPFWRAFSATAEIPVLASDPAAAVWRMPPEGGVSLAELGLLPMRPDWAAGLRETWAVGEAAAERRLEDFVRHGLAAYARDRDRPGLPGTSRLSPDLRWGHLSPQRVWHRVAAAGAADPALATGAEAFLRQLGWREFAHHVLFARPDMAETNLKPAFDGFPWAEDAAALRRWQSGETGYPLVDAAMRELWHTGWLHNRGRMIAASFLVKDLRQDWRTGLSWFEDTLVDADPALDPFGWQWAAGSGADAAPYFRIFSPVLQGERFDADGAYVRRWLSERADLPERWLHRPWPEVPAALRPAAAPPPVVEHETARREALAAFRALVV